MTLENSVVRQGVETFESLELIAIGVGTQQASTPPGLLKFEFGLAQEKKVYTFDWLSSVLYVDELLCNGINFPYAFTGKHMAGLYECHGSSYLERIQSDLLISGGTFKKHRHFIYWDVEFSWHITCEGVSTG